MALKLITPPTDLPISVAEAKERLGLSSNDSDDHVEALLQAATAYLDGPHGYLGRALMPQTWDLVYDSWPLDPIQIPLGPLISVDSVNYIDTTTEVETLFAASDYEVDAISDPGWIIVGEDGWPDLMSTTNAVRIRFIAGYPLTADSPPESGVPETIRLAICRLAHYWFDYRDVAAIPQGSELPYEDVKHLLASYRVFV
jgi:uncharacterized phiE125 gp8 family phage protein